MADQNSERPDKNEKVGEVVSTKMAKTIVVEVSRRVPHRCTSESSPSARSFTRMTRRARRKLGDVVRIIECRPMSKLKRWTSGRYGPPRRAGWRRA